MTIDHVMKRIQELQQDIEVLNEKKSREGNIHNYRRLVSQIETTQKVLTTNNEVLNLMLKGSLQRQSRIVGMK